MLPSSLTTPSIARRLGLGFSGILLLLIATAVISAVAMRHMGDQLRQIAEVNNLKTKLANDLMAHFGEMSVRARNAALFTEPEKIDKETASMKATEQLYLRDEQALRDAIDRPGATAEERALIDDIVTSRKKTLPLMQQAARFGAEGDSGAAVTTLTSDVQAGEVLWREKVGRLIALQDSLSQQAAADAATGQRRTLAAQLALIVFSVLAGSLIGWLITRSVTRPIGRAVTMAERIARGDLTTQLAEANANDEMGRLLVAMNAMQERLRDLVGGIHRSADSIQASSLDVASGNLDLSNRTEQASSQLQQTARSLTELTDTVKQSSESARQAHKRASGAAEVAARGGEVVAEVISTMDQINASSRQIAEIIGVIDGIAFQTNILALNAAVESARAGEQGRGFAVVAGEVRSLAGRSAEAAKQIKSLITTSVE
jgi:methyl-accepting chemotaxis protein